MTRKSTKQLTPQEELAKKMTLLPIFVGKMDSDSAGEATAFFNKAKTTFQEVNELQKELTGNDPGLSFKKLYELADNAVDPAEMEALKIENEELRAANANFAQAEQAYQKKILSYEKKKARKEKFRKNKQDVLTTISETMKKIKLPKLNKEGQIAVRCTGLLTTACIVGETIKHKQFELGYLADTAAALSSIPAVAAAGVIGGVVGGAVVGTFFDFAMNGFKALDPSNLKLAFEEERTTPATRHHRNKSYGILYGGIVLGSCGVFFGAINAYSWGESTYEWRHPETKKEIKIEKKKTAFNQSAEDVLSTKPNAVAWNSATASYTL